MKIVSREEAIEKFDENANRIVENIIEQFNNRINPDLFWASRLLYPNLTQSYINIVIDKLNELLKDYNYNASYEYNSIEGYKCIYIKYKKNTLRFFRNILK